MAIVKGIDQKKIVEHVVGSYTEWKDARKKKEIVWKDILNAYLTTVDESKYVDWPWRSKAADTFIQETGDSIASSLRNALFPISEEYFRINGLDEAGILGEKPMTVYMKRMLHKSNFIDKMKPYLKQLSILGNAPALLPWKTDIVEGKRRAQVPDEDTGELKTGVENYMRTRYDGFDFETLDCFDVVFDPNKVYLSQSPLIRRLDKTETSLKEMEGVYDNLDKIEHAKMSSDESEGDKRQRASVFGLEYSLENDKVELLEAYGDFEIDGEVYKDYIIVVANRNVLLRCEENPYWGGRPIVWGTYDDLWFTPYGKGPCEPVMGTYHLINTFTNQKSDVLNLIINGTFAYVDDGIIDPENIVMRPGGMTEEGRSGNIRSLNPNTNVTLAFNEIDSLRSRGERSTGASDYEKGATPSGKRTAYEANIIKQGSSSRFNDITKHQGDSIIEYILQHYLESIKQFKHGSGEIENEILAGDYEVEFLGADLSAVKSYETQQFMTFNEIIGRSPVFAQAINPIEMLKEWKKLFGIKNDKVIKTEEQMQQDQIAQQGGTPQGAPPEPNGGNQIKNPDMGLAQSGGEGGF